MASLFKSFMEQLSKVWWFLCFFFTKKWKSVKLGWVDKIDYGHILQQCEQEIQDLLEGNEVLNKRQCGNLVGKLSMTIRMIFKIKIATNESTLQFEPILQELYHVAKKVAILVKDCGRLDWCRAIIFQLENKEAFRELLLDLKCCYDAAYELCSTHHLDQMEDIEFDAATSNEVQLDQKVLKKRLEQALIDATFVDYELAKYLLRRLRDLQQVVGGDLDDMEVPNDFKKPLVIKKIFHGNYVSVDQAKWMDLPCVVKTIKGVEEHFRKEAGILGGLRHPNIINFFSCGVDKTIEESHLVMEPMHESLGQMLEERKRPIPYLVAIDIILQIAKGMCYLHDMHVAHCDLKPDNVVLSFTAQETRVDIPHYAFVKLIDFGISKIGVGSKPGPVENYRFGTKNYMAPEVIENTSIQPTGTTRLACPFEADVYSFAMICSELLSGQKPFSDAKNVDDILLRIRNHESPSLPPNCEDLNTLIRECWALQPSQRPTFSKICIQLTNIKKRFLVSKCFNDIECFDAFSNNSHESWTGVLEIMQGGSAKVSASPTQHKVIGAEWNISKVRDRLKEVNILGIIGMGGIGKTTLAKAIFDEKKPTYDASYLLEGLKNRSDCLEILHDILPKLGIDKNRMSKDLVHAQMMMKDLLVEKRVLLILDDIKDQDQVQSIIPIDVLHVLNNGTKLILTTRDWSAIKDCVFESGKIEVDKLDEIAAMELFTTRLFLDGGHLPTQFLDLAKEIVKACNGLPLSLKVMGAFLRGKEKLRIWERALQRMKRGRCLDGDKEESEDTKLWGILRTSFDELKNEEKDIFLDIACFFCRDVYPIGMSKETALRIWTNNGSPPVHALDTLVHRSLVKVDQKYAYLEMHDQLRDMGRMIIEKDHQYKGTRLWNVNMIPSNGFTSKDIKPQGIFYQGSISHFPVDMGDCNLGSLRLLSSYGTNNVLQNFDKLCSLAHHSFRLKCLLIYNSSEDHTCSDYKIKTNAALWRSCAQLNVLQLQRFSFSKQQLPIEIFSINTLLELNLSYCLSLTSLPEEMGNLTSLTTLELSGCSSLTSLPKGVGNLTSLTTLELSGCWSLTTLPKGVGNLTSLTTLDLSWCWSLTTLPEGVGNLTALTTLQLSDCLSLTTLLEGVGNLTSLTALELSYCSSLTTLPEGVENLTSLTTLRLSGCSSLTTLPEGVGNLISLTTLKLWRCSSLTTLPEGVGNLTSLTTLELSGCSRLTKLPEGVGNLTSLTTLELFECSSLTTLPKGVRNLTSLTTLQLSRCSSLTTLPEGIGNLTTLTTLELSECWSLTTLPEGVGNLTSLTTLRLSGWSSLTTLPQGVENLTSLTTLELSGCSSLTTLPEGVENLTSLTTLRLSGCSSLTTLPEGVGNLISLTTLTLWTCSSLTTLPEGVGNLTSLTTLELFECSSLTTLPKGVGNLTSLTTLQLSRCSSLTTLPERIGNLTALTTLQLSECWSLTTLPKGVGNLTSLTTLQLSECLSLTTLPEGVENLSSLTTLQLSGCSSLTTLPEGVGNLTSLTTLQLSRCSSLTTLPEGVGNLSSLTTLQLSGCWRLTTLPKGVENLTSLTTLQLSWCSRLTTLPEGVGNLTSLTTLQLSECSSLRTLPEGMGNLTSLTTLELSGCSSLTTLPEGVWNLLL